MRTKQRSLTVDVLCRMPPAKVRVVAGKDDAVYVVHRIPSEWGRAYKVCRLDAHGEEITDRSYDVNLDGPDHCHCWDYLTTQDCKHCAAAWAVCKGESTGLVTIKCEIVERRPKSVRILAQDGELHFLPLSQTKVEQDGVTIPEWLAREKGLL